MLIRELFAADVTRDIPPVVYFHEQAPERLADEVREYIFTGGFPEGDPRGTRVGSGIHEELVRLLTGIRAELEKPGGPALPASWISGFFGSGKSSFAKLLGLALDGALLPGGEPLSQAFLSRDESPLAPDLRKAWDDLLSKVSPMAVVFDIGSVARDGEQVHSAAKRQIQKRLGYCPVSHLVADWEAKLEADGLWDAFVLAAEEALRRPWDVAKREQLAPDHFSHALSVLDPERYPEPTTWIDSHAGDRSSAGSSVEEAVRAIAAMLDRREPGKTLFFVIDEVSQYVHHDETRMLKLQTFVSDLGQRLKGRAWILATGQQKLEEEAAANPLSKLKDRFPQSLRVHLATTNIRDVVHKRLLKKDPAREPDLRKLFREHRTDLKLYAYACEEITEEEFVEVYPMLPGQVDLILRLTSSLRSRSSRARGDDHAIRGLLQLLGEVFRGGDLADAEAGALVTLDAVFEVQQSALDVDVQTTLGRIMDHEIGRRDPLALRTAKAVALLELIQDETPTTADLVTRCLYQRLGEGNRAEAVTSALEALRGAGLLGYSERTGYKIQSSAGGEWQRERDDIGVPGELVSGIVAEKLRELLGDVDRGRLQGRPISWTVHISDGRHLKEKPLLSSRDEATVVVDLRFLSNRDDRLPARWIPESGKDALRDRLIWVSSEPALVGEVARDLARSRQMIERHKDREASLPLAKKRLLSEERAGLNDLETKLGSALRSAFLEGAFYFRGREMRPSDLGSGFAGTLQGAAEKVLPDLFPHFISIAVAESELLQLLEPTLAGPSTKFLDQGLGILALDAGRYVPACSGPVPTRIRQYIEKESGVSGATLVASFGGVPYGWPADVVKAAVAGLLRAHAIRIRPEDGPEISSIKDPGTRDLFRRDRDFRRADLFPAGESEVSPRDRVAICQLFKDRLGLDLDREDEAIAEAVFSHFPLRRERLGELRARLLRLPGPPPVPEPLIRLERALTECQRTRQVAGIVAAVKRHLDDLRDGLTTLDLLRAELTDTAIEALLEADRVVSGQARQLADEGALEEVAADVEALREHLRRERPWREAAQLRPIVDRVRAGYVDVRRSLLATQEENAEAARGRIMARDGFSRLSADAAHRVLQPISRALVDPTATVLAPPLVELGSGALQRLVRAEQEANERLDAELARLDSGAITVVPLDVRLSGREVRNSEELEALLKELRERIGAVLERGEKVRLL